MSLDIFNRNIKINGNGVQRIAGLDFVENKCRFRRGCGGTGVRVSFPAIGGKPLSGSGITMVGGMPDVGVPCGVWVAEADGVPVVTGTL